MKLTLLSLSILFTSSMALADRSEGRAYNDAGATVTHDCAKEPRVAVNGSEGSYTFIGTCEKIAINGSSVKVTIAAVDRLAVNGSTNTVDVDAANKIAVTGSSNTVTYRKGIAGAKPKTTSLGVENTITQRK